MNWQLFENQYFLDKYDVSVLRVTSKHLKLMTNKTHSKYKIITFIRRKMRSYRVWINKVIHLSMNRHLFWRLEIEGLPKTNFTKKIDDNYDPYDFFFTCYPLCTHCNNRNVSLAIFFSTGTKMIKSDPFLTFTCDSCLEKVKGDIYSCQFDIYQYPTVLNFSKFQTNGSLDWDYLYL